MVRRLLAAVFFVVLAASQARADLTLDYQGVTDGNSSLAGKAIAPGTKFEIEVGFPSTPYSIPGTGEGLYAPTSLRVEVGGTTYSPSLAPGYEVILADNTGGLGVFIPGFRASGTGAFLPGYTAATTTGWVATAPTPTKFSGYLGSLERTLTFSTSAGTLIVDYDPGVGVTATISAVPEPSTFAVALIGGVAAIVLVLRRRGIAA
jgi:PEP-CTERM motif